MPESKSEPQSSQPPKGRKMAPIAAVSEGQPLLDVDQLKETLDAHVQEGEKQQEVNEDVAAKSTKAATQSDQSSQK